MKDNESNLKVSKDKATFYVNNCSFLRKDKHNDCLFKKKINKLLSGINNRYQAELV